jgi:hypothetical protein
MRPPVRFALLAGFLAFIASAPAADEPLPLLKPVPPGNGSIRVRIPTTGPATFKAQVPRGKGKKGEMIDITVVFGLSGTGGSTSLKTFQSWGYEADKPGSYVLPELVVPASQISPKLAKGHDINIHVPMIKVELYEYAGDVAPKDGGAISLGLGEVSRASSQAAETRLHLVDKFLEFTTPNMGLKRPGTDLITVTEAKPTADPALVVSAAPGGVPDSTTFAFSSVNGLTQYKTPDGKIEPVVTSFSHMSGPPIIMSFRLAHGCGVEMEEPKGDFSYLKGKVRELRVAFQTGKGLTGQKDFVLRDVPVLVSSEKTTGHVVLGTEFAAEYCKDAIIACGPDGFWRLHGRVKPDFLQDIKTRTPPKKP